jgi:hypothetical protein
VESEERRRFITRIAFSPDGQLLASTNRQEITLWDLHTQRRPQVLRTGESVDRTRELVFSADGSRLRTNRGMWPLPGASELAIYYPGRPCGHRRMGYLENGSRLVDSSPLSLEHRCCWQCGSICFPVRSSHLDRI